MTKTERKIKNLWERARKLRAKAYELIERAIKLEEQIDELRRVAEKEETK